MITRSRFVLVLVGVVAALLPASAAASVTRLVPSGNAWGSTANLGATVLSGRTAYSSFGCGGTFDSNNVSSVGTAGLRTGAVTTQTRSLKVNGSLASRSTTVVNNLNLLNGLITAEAVKAVSTTSRDASGFASTGAGSSFATLRIGGKSVNANPGQRVDLPGVGYVLLNRRINQDGGASHTTRMVEVHVTQNLSGLTAGSTIIVGHAGSRLRRAGGLLGGFAFGSSGAASSGTALATDAGPSARIYLPCAGTNDEVLRNQIATVHAPSVFTLSNVVSTARGKVAAATANGRLTNTVEQADVLGGLVKAKAVRAVASASADNGNVKLSTTGSSFGALSARGFPGINRTVAANTRREIAGLGTLWLRRVIRGANQIEVRMIELHVTQKNDRGLPVGAVVRVGVARARVH